MDEENVGREAGEPSERASHPAMRAEYWQPSFPAFKAEMEPQAEPEAEPEEKPAPPTRNQYKLKGTHPREFSYWRGRDTMG